MFINTYLTITEQKKAQNTSLARLSEAVLVKASTIVSQIVVTNGVEAGVVCRSFRHNVPAVWISPTIITCEVTCRS